jgi:hypothetical protein
LAYDNAGLFGEAAHILTDGASTLTLGVSATPGAINLNGVAGASVALRPALSGNTAFIFPATNGSAGQVLSTDGAGNTSWVAGGGGSGTVTSVTLDPSTTGLQVNGAAAPDTITTSGTFVLSGVLATSNGGTGTSAASNTATGVAILGAGGSLEPIYGGTGTTTTFASGSVIFADASGNYAEDNASFFWANGINQLCLGGNIPVGGPPNIQLNVKKDAFIAGMTVGLGGGQDSTNTAVGSGVLNANTGSDNTGVGSGALQANVAGNNNTAVGSSALITNSGGSFNTSFGAYALTTNASANNNTAVGYAALRLNSSGANNTAVGTGALLTNVSSSGNTAVGSGALNSSTAGNNTAVGNSALNSTTSGTNNVAVGDNALRLSTGNRNTGVGSGSGSQITIGSFNTLIGAYDGSTAPVSLSGSNYVVLSDGAGAIRFATNSAGALSFDGSSYGTAGQVLQSNGNAAAPTWVAAGGGITVGTTTITSGTAGSIPYNDGTVYSEDNANLFWDSANTQLCIGTNSTAVTPNIFLQVAKDALINGITAGLGDGQDTTNTVFGAAAYATGSSSNNTAFGSNALNSSTGLGLNAAFGSSALAVNAGGGNTGIGHRALTNCSGSRNTAVGRLAMSFATVAGIENTALGISALGFLTSGSYNTALGKSSGFNITTGSYNTIIGAYDAVGAPIFGTGNNYVVLSDGAGNVPVFWEGLTANQICNGPVIMQGYTVSTLPTPPVKGMRAYVTDASLPTFLGIISGGGLVNCPVFYDGTNWVAG